MEPEDRIILICLHIEEIYLQITKGRRLRLHGFEPALSDVEVLTMEIVGELEGRNGDRAIWRYFNEHWREWFPNLSAYKTFAKHCANLCWIRQLIMQRLFGGKDDVYIIDGVPMPVCHNARAYRSRMLEEFTAWGYCAAKDEKYYGLRGHAVMSLNGFITAFIVTPANLDERLSMGDLTGQIKGMLIGDKGFIDQKWPHLLMAHDIDLQTPLRDNMPDDRPGWAVKQLLKVRKSIETALSALINSFSLDKIKAHDVWHFSNKLFRKILAYNFYVMLRS
jgi:hypothetical protein